LIPGKLFCRSCDSRSIIDVPHPSFFCLADEALKVLLEKTRDGFEGGIIELSDLVNWMLVNHEKLIADSEIRTIRALHFDEMLALNMLVKVANQGGGLSEELKAQFKSLLNGSSKKNKE
jgi:hypothetical protein